MGPLFTLPRGTNLISVGFENGFSRAFYRLPFKDLHSYNLIFTCYSKQGIYIMRNAAHRAPAPLVIDVVSNLDAEPVSTTAKFEEYEEKRQEALQMSPMQLRVKLIR